MTQALPPFFIYLHGFNSSPESMKGQLLKQHFEQAGRADQLWMPMLSSWPEQAVQQVLDKIASLPAQQPVLVVGSSLGGYYATAVCESPLCQSRTVRAVLVNPAVYPYKLLAQWLGENQNFYRAESYTLTEQHLEQLLNLDCPTLQDPERYLLLVQTGDMTLNYLEAVDKYAQSPQFVQSGGGHGFDYFERLIPAIESFAEGQVILPEAVALPRSDD